MAGHKAAAVLGVLIAAAAAPAFAQQPPAPTVAVVGFALESGAKLSAKQTDAMVESLAIQLVESGRYRVMDREFLGIANGSTRLAPMPRVQATAAGAGVDYLIVGHIQRYTETYRYQAAPAMMPMPGYRAPFSAIGMRPRTVTRHADYLRFSVDVLDAKTGAVVTRAIGSCVAPPKSGPTAASMLALAPAAPVAMAAAAIAHKRSSSTLSPGMQSALNTVTQALLRWNPPAAAGAFDAGGLRPPAASQPANSAR